LTYPPVFSNRDDCADDRTIPEDAGDAGHAKASDACLAGRAIPESKRGKRRRGRGAREYFCPALPMAAIMAVGNVEDLRVRVEARRDGCVAAAETGSVAPCRS
jgi:hypothetical protein